MMHMQVDGTADHNIVGFEVGTKLEFDARHAGDSNWMFVELTRLKENTDLEEFLLGPNEYRIADNGDVIKREYPDGAVA